MATVTDIKELLPVAQMACNLFLAECKKRGVDIFITETYRSQQRQNELYAQGRTAPGNIVTWTLSSRHTSRLAWDIATNGSELYNLSVLRKAGQIAEKLGITWGGKWTTPDMPHFEVSTNWKLPKGADEMTIDEVKSLVKTRYGFDDNTMLYLEMYRYGEALLRRLCDTEPINAESNYSLMVKTQFGFDENTMKYLEFYKYGSELIKRIAKN